MPAKSVELVDEMQNDIDTLVVDAKIAFEVPDQMSARDVLVQKARFSFSKCATMSRTIPPHRGNGVLSRRTTENHNGELGHC
jgi:hypothetical protein